MPLECLDLPASGPPSPESRLIAALAFFRHGARTPCHVITAECGKLPKVRWTAEMVGDEPGAITDVNFFDLQGKPVPDAFDIAYRGKPLSDSVVTGQLLRSGQCSHVRRGHLLRARYVDRLGLVPPAFDRHKVFCRSTLFHRNLMSMRSLMAGMFPGDAVDVFLCTEDSGDVLMSNPVVSRTVGLSSVEAEKTREEWSALRKELKALWDCPNNTPLILDSSYTSDDLPLSAFRDEIICRMSQQLATPELSEEALQRMDRACFQLFLCDKMGLEPTREMFSRKAAAGPILDFILTKLQGVECGDDSTPLSIFLTHDDLLSVLVEALGIADGEWPPFGASFVVELYRRPDGHCTVHVFWRGQLVLRETWSLFQKRLSALALPFHLVPAFMEKHMNRVQ